MAQQVLIYRLTGSAAALGIVNLIALIPLIPLSLWSGSIADRFPKRTILIITQTAQMLQALILAVLCWTGSVQIWHVYILAFLLGAATAIDLPARQAFTVDMVEGKDDLTNAIGLNSAMFNTARAIGPALAGMVVAATGEGNAFFLNALSFIAVIVSLMVMRNLPVSHQPISKETGTLSHMAAGINFMRSQQVMMVLVSLIAVSAFLSMPYNTLMPVFAERVLSTSAQPIINYFCDSQIGLLQCQAPEALPLGFLLTTVGIGAVIAAIFVASLPDNVSHGKWLTFGNLAFPAFLLIFGLSKSFILSLIVLFCVGFSFVLQNALANTLLQMIAPDEMRGRVMGLYSMSFQAMMRLGGLQAGLVADWIGAGLSVAIGAGVSLVYGLFVALRYPAVRKLR